MSSSRGSIRRGDLRFCPETSDLLYPREDKTRKVLKYACRTSEYEEDVPQNEWCIYENRVKHSDYEKTTVLRDVRADPTLPRSRDVRCSQCNGTEAVFFSSSTPEGMSLFYQCTQCGHKWKDEV